MNHCDSFSHVQLPLLQQDIVGVVASFLDILDLRQSFNHVCKLWFAVTMDIIKGTFVYPSHSSVFTMTNRDICIMIILICFYL